MGGSRGWRAMKMEDEDGIRAIALVVGLVR